MTEPDHLGWQGDTITRAGVAERLDRAGSLVALERLAQGGGDTNWFVATCRQDLTTIADRLRPGSLVTFYFDNRIARRPYTGTVRTELLDIIERKGDALIGWLRPDGVSIRMRVVDAGDLDEEVLDAESDDDVYFGAFPATDNDGADAITVTIPDEDGVVRVHAY
ncbi:hypothetical protein [Amycolatopsis sp. cmx-11-12]|uniref:hypothetical protein n=1 Tax=Amycolatopsis sp. cmx-11-12 TaxID=2785795 RepID=UPI00391839A1